MKTDCAGLGRESLRRLEAASKHAGQVQEDFLLHWLKENRDTEFGKRYSFGGMDTVEKYRRKVPLSVYEDYEEEIGRIVGGEENVLTKEKAVYFCISSGTVGEEKYVPLTGSDLEMHYIYMYGAVFGQIRKYYGNLPEEEIFGKIFQIGEFAKTYMPDGRMKGIRSSCIYQWLDETVGFDVSDYCVPREILFPEDLEERLYVKVRFALAERDLTAIHGVFINRAAGAVEYILRNWELLLRDMEQGTVSITLDENRRHLLQEKLPPDPVRAQELRRIPPEDLAEGAVKKIWKKMKYILVIGGAGFPYYTDKMREYAGEIPIHYFIYAASEGVFGLAEKVGQEDRYMLLPESVFFEFIPVNAGDQTPVLLDDVKIGGKYEIVVTNRSGLYRYRMGDVVEVVGRHESAPVVKFCYRINQVINIAGEKSNKQQFDDAVRRFSLYTRTHIKGYCVQEDIGEMAPRYLFYMECDEIPGDADRIFEECLCRANTEYRSCRSMGEIQPLHIEFLQEGSFERYEQRLAGEGKSLTQSKMPHLLDTEEKKDFFASRLWKREGYDV